MGQLQTHQIRVETEDDLVTVQIGGEGSVPGGFAKFFNRVVDSEAWARLSDTARAAYIPMVRFADHRNQYRVQIGLAALMKYAGLSRSSIKRAIKDLLGSRLLVLLEQGGVTPDGRNESNLYQLMIPVEAKPRWPIEPLAYPQPNPQGVRVRTPSQSAPEPTAGSEPNPVSVLARTPPPARWTDLSGVAAGPQLRKTKEKEDSSRFAGVHPEQSLPRANTNPDAAVLLEENGVERTIAR